MNIARAVQWATVKTALSLLKASGAYAGYWNAWRGRPFDAAERMGLHIMPVHYYSPIPDVGNIQKAAWKPRSAVAGVDLRLGAASELAHEFDAKFGAEYRLLNDQATDDRRRFTLANTGFGAGDAEIYYAMLRHLKPRRVIEIGCGYSTLVAALALAKNRDEGAAKCRYACVEPFLPDYLRPPPDEAMDIVETSVQELSLDFFKSLRDGDILFIDSTHVAAFGSDVVYEYLEILPRLNPGVIVHIHDIFLPFDYPEDWIRNKRFFWNEQYLLQAFLLHNDEYEVLMPLHALFAADKGGMTKLVPSLATENTRPASFWMRKKA